MNEKLLVANRKTVEHDRIAICPIYGCDMKKKLKPLKFGLFGFSKHPMCSRHQRSLVYADELVEEFFSACTSCLFDRSALPPSSLLEQLRLKDSEYIPYFIDAWIYCSSTGRNGRVISNYVDGLSRGYMSLLSRKEKKAVDRGDPKKRHQMLVSGIQKIISDYAKFLNYLGEKTDELLPSLELVPHSPMIKHAIKHWVDAQLLGLKTSKPTSILAEKKELFDGMLSIGTALNLLGKSNDILNKMISPHELFSGYREFLRAGLTRELICRDIINLKAKYDSTGKNDEEQEVFSIREEQLSNQELLNNFLDSKLELIQCGLYFPTKPNLNRDFPISQNFVTIQKMVSKWLKSNGFSFNNVTDMKIYFKKIDKVPILEQVYRFLDKKINEINNMEYIPTYKCIVRDMDIEKFDSHYIISWFKSRYKEKRLKFKSLTELKREAGMIKNAQLVKFLEIKKEQIKNLEFLPTIENILQDMPDFKEVLTNKEISTTTLDWLRRNGMSLSELKVLGNQGLYYYQLEQILNPLKKEIINCSFIPTTENVIPLNNELKKINYLSDFISRWLKENNIATNLSEYLYNAGILNNTQILRNFLDSKYDEILRGNYYPTIKNLRREQDLIGIIIDSYSTLNNTRYEWFNERIGKTMNQIIEEFEPTYDQLGVQLTSHGYPPKFKSQKFRIFNAIFQTVMIGSEGDDLILFEPPKKFSSFQSLFNYLRKNGKWNFVDILTGDIFTLQDYLNGEIGLHHINFKKTDIRPDNLVFLFKNYHNFITMSRHHFTDLYDFFTGLLVENVDSLKKNQIPASWKIGWRKLALQSGIRLPLKRYKSNKIRSHILKRTGEYKKLDSFLKNKK